MKNSNASQKSGKFWHTTQQFPLEMEEITKKQQNIGGGEGALAMRKKKIRWLVGKQVIVSKDRICNCSFKDPKKTSR